MTLAGVVVVFAGSGLLSALLARLPGARGAAGIRAAPGAPVPRARRPSGGPGFPYQGPVRHGGFDVLPAVN